MQQRSDSTTLREETVDLFKLGERERKELGEKLYREVQQAIFEDVDFDSFYSEVIFPQARDAHLSLYSNANHEWVGYLQYCHSLCTLEGKPCVLVRSATGLLPSYRNKTAIGSASASYLLGLYLRYPLRSIYVFTSPINPVSYKTIARTLAEYWPSPWVATPPEKQNLLKAICEFYNYKSLDNNPMVRDVGWKVKGIKQMSFPSDDTLIQYYISQNPRYVEGYGLMVLSPIHLKNLLSGVKRLLSKRWKSLWPPQQNQSQSTQKVGASPQLRNLHP